MNVSQYIFRNLSNSRFFKKKKNGKRYTTLATHARWSPTSNLGLYFYAVQQLLIFY